MAFAVADESSPISDTPPATVAARSLGLLLLEGMSLGLCGWALRVGDKALPYVSTNTLSPAARKFVVGNMAAGAGVLLTVAIVILVWRRQQGLEFVYRLSHRLAPLCLAAFVPPLLHWQFWAGGRELTFLTLVTVFGLSLQGLFRLSLTTPPVFAASSWERLGTARREIVRLLDRIPRLRAALPTVLVIAGAVAYTIYFTIITVHNHMRLSTMGFDLGIENNLMWNASHFNLPLFKTSVLAGPDSTHLGYHQTYISYLLGIPYRLYPRPEALLALQAALIGSASIPLYLFARRHLGNWTACLLSWLCLAYAPLHGSNLYDFHYLPFAPFFLWLCLWLLEARKDKWATLAIILTLATREDFSALLTIVGLYLVLSGERPRAGLLVTAIAGAFFVGLKLVLMPRFLNGYNAYINQYQDLLPEGDSGFFGILKTVFGNPWFTTTSLLERDKLVYILQIMVPVAFLPWRRPIGILCTLPGFLFTLLATRYPPLIQISFQYTAYWTSFLFIAIVANLTWMRRQQRNAPTPILAGAMRAGRRSWLIAMTAATILTSNQFGAVLQHNTAWGGFAPFKFGIDADERARLRDLNDIIALIPPLARVAAGENIVAHVSSRPNAYSLRIGRFDAEYLVLWIPRMGDERADIRELLKSGTFGAVKQQGEFALCRQGADTTENESLLARIPE